MWSNKARPSKLGPGLTTKAAGIAEPPPPHHHHHHQQQQQQQQTTLHAIQINIKYYWKLYV